MAITAKELAKKLNLSESAISLALNHKPGVSTATRKRVLAAAEAYGYDLSKHMNTKPAASRGTIYFVISFKLVDCLEKCLICRHIRRFAD